MDTLIEFELNQRVEIVDEEHAWFGSTGVIIRLEESNFYIVALDFVDEQTEVSGDQLMPYMDEIPF